MSKIQHVLLLVLGTVFQGGDCLAQEASSHTLQQLLETAYCNHPGILAFEQHALAQRSLIASVATLQNPRVGISSLQRGDTTYYGFIHQKLDFPAKYFFKAKAQQALAKSKVQDTYDKKLVTRQQVISLYYAIYASQKIIQLIQTDIATVEQMVRIQRQRYAAGIVPQNNAIKAQVELIHLQLDLVKQQQQEEALQEQFKAALHDHTFSKLLFSHKELSVPSYDFSQLDTSFPRLSSVLHAQSPKLKSEVHRLRQAGYANTLSKWSYAPDFQLQYQPRLLANLKKAICFLLDLQFPSGFGKTTLRLSLPRHNNELKNTASWKKHSLQWHMLET